MFLEFEKEDGGAVAVEDGDVCALGDVRAGLVDVYLRSGPVVRVRGDYADVLRRVKDPYEEENLVGKIADVTPYLSYGKLSDLRGMLLEAGLAGKGCETHSPVWAVGSDGKLTRAPIDPLPHWDDETKRCWAELMERSGAKET